MRRVLSSRTVSSSSWLRAAARRSATAALTALLGFAGAVAVADETATDPAEVRAVVARLEANKVALLRASSAVVGIETVAVEDARSIPTLGRERQGSGILIGDDGLVLTIGYLILEADHVDLVTANGRRVPARVVAYDLASGFGLVQALAPLGVAPAPLGISAKVGGDDPLVVASGGDDRDLSLAKMVSRRPFSGYWGIPHRRRAVHGARAHRPQRRRPLHRRGRARRRRIAARRQRRRRCAATCSFRSIS